ncbi:BON domain-containing protein [Deinococcus psychrotolerans]|uniref:BON domain-containing protein n=1 Tax=Deinococcus psychrotolerans TaxID=2489213 RepID=A0A3G8YGV9_9DEIO|nr:BON domain-containing protein [Deinococcus psychrotolerans]AZI44203.1 BON domain-containing protein [Deinococcus psychrotolerans]
MTIINDGQLQSDVMDELLFEPSLDAGQIAVSVKGGIVTLAGSVANYPEKWAAETAVKRVRGVQGVAEKLTVHFRNDPQHSDAEIARAARQALEWSAALPDQDIQLRVENGWITLEGVVEWQVQRQRAHDLVANLLGVRGVNTLLTLRPQVTSTGIHTRIEAAFKRSSELDAGRVQVEVVDGNVTLRGELPNWTEINAAGLAAWNAAGVITVDNQIRIEA